MTPRARVGSAFGLMCMVAAAASAPAQQSPELHLPGPARSGYTFLTPQTRALQDDAFANPGMLWVEQGEKLWSTPAGDANRSCSGCHGDAGSSMRGVAAGYPRYDAKAGRVVNIEQRINLCRTENQKAAPLVYESQELLSLTSFVNRQSLGMPVSVAIDGPALSSFRRGQAMYEMRQGQLNLNCAACHERSVGSHLRAEVISQGQINGFPIYRQLWQTMGSTHRMFAWCNTAIRAEPFAAGSQEYVDLELYVRARGLGLSVETPAVRR